MNSPSELQKLIVTCELGTTASESFYVQRQPSVLSQLEAGLFPTPTSRVLLMGQNGVGKSTELHQLAHRLWISNAPYLVVKPPLDVGMDLRQPTWHELLLFTACFASHSKPHQHLSPAPLQTILRTLAANSVQEILHKMRHEPTPIRNRIAEARASLWDASCGLLSALAASFGRHVMVIWDGLEKLSRSETLELFEKEGRHLEDLPFAAVITAPMRMSFEAYFHEVSDRFSGNVVRLRAMSREQLKELAVKRGVVMSLSEAVIGLAALMSNKPYDSIYESLINRLLDMSGGLPRQLLQLTASSAKVALSSGAPILMPEHVALAIRRASETLRYQLQPADFEELAKPDSKRSNEARARLLDLRALIENDDPKTGFRLDVNPLIPEILAAGK